MESAQQITFTAIFALCLLGLAVYFVSLTASAWRQIASPFFRVALVAGCMCFWSLGAVGFSECCVSWARQFRHTQVAYDFRQISGLFLCIAAATFVISFAGVAFGMAESALRGRKPSNQAL
jgi:hypothetical protein